MAIFEPSGQSNISAMTSLSVIVILLSISPSVAFLAPTSHPLKGYEFKSGRSFQAPGVNSFVIGRKSKEVNEENIDPDDNMSSSSMPPGKSNTTSSILDKVKEQTISEGIGGQGGHVYDVNLFKRNLLQDTMVAYKAELFKLLNSPRSNEQEISDKLSALVEGSPVRTTSDSNLLEGTWALAYSTFSTAKSSFFLIRYQSSVVSPHAFVSHSLNFFFFSSFQALVCEKSSRVWKSATDSQKQQFRLSQNTCHEADRRQRIALLVCGQIIFSRRTR